MKGLPWRIGVAKDHATKKITKTMRKDHKKRPSVADPGFGKGGGGTILVVVENIHIFSE